MLKVLIIDDEPLVRIGLKSMLKWDELDYQIIGEAANGQLGLDLIIKYQPDIVITDIKMPVMDGLEMMRLSLQAEQCPKFIILSSYDQFQLVKQAMKLGAEEYLIKLDLVADTLKQTLEAVKEKILNERSKIDNQALLEKSWRDNLNMLREGFFERIITKASHIQTELDDQAVCLGIELNEQLACAVIRINNRRSLKKYDADEMRLFEVSLCNTINEVVNDSFKGYTFSWNPGEFVTVFSSDGGMTPEIYRQKVGEMGERLVHIVKQYFNISISIGFSNPCRGYAELHQAYLESYRAFQSSYDTEEREVAIFDELTENNQVQTKIDIIELKDLISNGIELHEQESVRIAFAKAQSVLHGPAINRERAYDLCLQLAYLIKGVSGLSETELKAIIGYDHSLYETILRLNTLVEIIDWLSGLEERICSYIHRKDETKNHRLIIKAKKYILEHYPEEFGLNEVASAINISPGYLSTIFRQYTGMCFSDYVTEVRIDQAKKLLRESDYKIYEISEMLGYQNAYYFSKVFKKITGMSPSEFSGKQM